ncbi:hypothetical protein [Tsuneonella sp. HG222]
MRTLQERLASYLIKRPYQWVAKGFIEDLARETMGVTAETVGRRLRVLHEVCGTLPPDRPTSEHETAIKLLQGGKIEVEYRGKNHAHYRYVPPKSREVRRVEIREGRAVEIIEHLTTEI